jgi:GrpB-like predicted nucleotidyltransferase (UPF0157 family)
MEGIFDGANLGLHRGSVVLRESDPAWATAYGRLAGQLRPALAGLVTAIEHVGSTAVPGLPAKPILDVAIGLEPGTDPAPVTAALESLGFLYRGSGSDGETDLMFGFEDEPRRRVVNAHVVTHGGALWRDYVDLRDRLRSDPDARSAYARLKQDLAERYPGDRHSYVDGKSDFVARLLASRSS